MPKNHNQYPQFSFELCTELAERVLSFGGEVHSDELAASMDRANSGAFRVLISAAAKHGLLAYTNYTIYLSSLGKQILSTTDTNDREELSIKAFLLPPVYTNVTNKWNDGLINERTIESYLVSLGVDKAHLVKRNYLMGARSLGVLAVDGIADMTNEPQDDRDRREKLFEKSDFGTSAPTAEHSEKGEDKKTTPEIKPSNETQEQIMMNQTSPIKEDESSVKPSLLSEERVSVQTLLTGARVAELSVPKNLSIKDYDILKAWLDVLKMSLQNQE